MAKCREYELKWISFILPSDTMIPRKSQVQKDTSKLTHLMALLVLDLHAAGNACVNNRLPFDFKTGVIATTQIHVKNDKILPDVDEPATHG